MLNNELNLRTRILAMIRFLRLRALQLARRWGQYTQDRLGMYLPIAQLRSLNLQSMGSTLAGLPGMTTLGGLLGSGGLGLGGIGAISLTSLAGLAALAGLMLQLYLGFKILQAIRRFVTAPIFGWVSRRFSNLRAHVAGAIRRWVVGFLFGGKQGPSVTWISTYVTKPLGATSLPLGMRKETVSTSAMVIDLGSSSNVIGSGVRVVNASRNDNRGSTMATIFRAMVDGGIGGSVLRI